MSVHLPTYGPAYLLTFLPTHLASHLPPCQPRLTPRLVSSHSKAQRSDLRYSPVSDLDYGTLLCWATNLVGTQRTPCTFTVFPAGKPDAVASCRVFNETEESVSVSCEPGYSGGVDQSFLIEAWDDGVVRATDTSDAPLMEVRAANWPTSYFPVAFFLQFSVFLLYLCDKISIVSSFISFTVMMFHYHIFIVLFQSV